MNLKPYRLLILAILLVLVSAACLVPSKKAATESEPSNPPTAEIEEPPSKTAPESNPASGAAGDFVFDEGGFQFTPLPNWEITCAIGIIQMKAPDADPDFGPVFMIMAGDNDTEMTTDEAFEKFQNESTGSEIGKPRKVKVGGFPALQAELASQQGGQDIKALVITSMLTSKRQFTMMASAPAGRWEDEVEPYFEQVRDSIKFIDIVPGAGCPNGEDDQEADVEPEDSNAAAADGLLHQWAVQAKASSQYSDPEWAASQAVGEPNVEDCLDSSDAWASNSPNGKDWIELTYATPVLPTEINIHMNYNPSQVTKIQIMDINGKSYTVVETEPEEVPYCPDVYQISLELTRNILVNKVKIFIDQSILNLGWNEIDAVELVGIPQDSAALPAKPQKGGQPESASPAPYQPQELDSGTFAYDVSGYEQDTIQGANVQYQSNDNTYVVALVSGTERYIANLLLPRTGLKEGYTQLKPYDDSATNKSPTAAIYINAFLYIADSGEITLQSDPASGRLTGTFYFKAHSKDYPDRVVEVAGAVNNVPLK